MQVEMLSQPENSQHIGVQQVELDKSQGSAQREMTSIHIKMKNQAESQKEIKSAQMNHSQFKQSQDIENQFVINKGNQSNPKINSQKQATDHNKLQIYKQENSARGEKGKEMNDHSVLNVINSTEYHKAQKQEIVMINNSNEDNCEEPLLSPENKIVNGKCSVDNTLFSLFFTLITVAGIILYIYAEIYWLIIVGAVLYYLECYCTSFLDIFERTISESDFDTLYKNALQEEPQIQFKVSAFIIVNKSKKKSNTSNTNITVNANTNQQQQQNQQRAQGQLNPQVQSKQKKEEYISVRELVYSEQRSFDFSQHKDFSHSLQSQKEFFATHGLIKIKPVIYWRCGNEETQNAYNKMQNDVLEISKQRSGDIEKVDVTYSIPFEDSSFIVKSSGKSSPFFFNKTSYLIFSLIFLSFPFRIYYLNKIRILEMHICKKVFI